MHYLLISTYLGPSIGGLEIQIARISKWLINRGHKATLLANTVCGFRDLYPENMRIVELGDRISQLCFYHKAGRMWTDIQIARPDVIKTFDLRAAWIASVLSSSIKPAPRVLFGNYFPNFIPKSQNPLKHAIYRLFLLNLRRNFHDDSILCMSEEHIAEFQRHYGNHRHPQFWPLPIEDLSENGPARNPRWGNIVSVGRLAPMKEYNLYMIDVIARLRRKGYPVRWTVYGEGELDDAMKTRINARGLSEAIELKGRLSNSQFAAAMQHAYVFVGMGAAVVEAALCGVPGVVALAHDTSGVTYGPLYQFRFGNVGELMDTAPGTTVEAEIERLLQLSAQEYESEVLRTREYAKAYAIDPSMDRFLEIVAKASAPKASYTLFYWYYLLSLLRGLRQEARVKA